VVVLVVVVVVAAAASRSRRSRNSRSTVNVPATFPIGNTSLLVAIMPQKSGCRRLTVPQKEGNKHSDEE